jgi:hypothetical protein
MNCVYNTKDYLKRKLSGEDVVSAATLYGYQAKLTNLASGTFYVLVMNMNDFSLLKYKMSEGRFHVDELRESVSYSLSDIVSSDMIHDKATMKWWEAVFFEHDGECTYDTYYDFLKISKKSDTTFKELIEKVTSIISTLQLPKTSYKMFLSGDYANNYLIRYALQQELSVKQINVLPKSDGKESFEENSIVSLPDIVSEDGLSTTPFVKLDTLLTSSINVTLPLCSVDCFLANEFRWKDVLTDMVEDYSAGNLGFKIINIHVECDALQNTFLSCHDLRGNKKVVKLS